MRSLLRVHSRQSSSVCQVLMTMLTPASSTRLKLSPEMYPFRLRVRARIFLSSASSSGMFFSATFLLISTLTAMMSSLC